MLGGQRPDEAVTVKALKTKWSLAGKKGLMFSKEWQVPYYITRVSSK